MLLFSSDLHLKVQLNFNVKLDFIQMMNGPKSCGKVDVPPHRIWLVDWLVSFFSLFEEKKFKAGFLHFLSHGSKCSHLSSQTGFGWLGGHSMACEMLELQRSYIYS